MEQTAPRTPGRVARAVRLPGYLILSFVIVQSVSDVLANTAPMLPRLVAWRVRTIGIAANSLTAPLLAFLLLYVLVLASERRVVLWALLGITSLAALGLLALSGTFALDVVQLGRSVPDGEKSRYYFSTAYALLKLGIGILSLLLLGWVGFRTVLAQTKDAAAAAAKPNLLVRVGGEGVEPRTTPATEPTAVEPPVA